MSTITQTDLTEEELERLHSVIKHFLVCSERDELFETRIQKLIFYAEVYCILHYRRRLTSAEYRPYMYGAFSRDVRDAINSLDDITRRKTVIQSDRTTAYSLDRYEDSESIDIRAVIEKVCNHVDKESTEELAQFSKNSWLFENTEYNHPMEFPEFAEALDANPEIEEELRSRMPPSEDLADSANSLVEITR